MTQPMRLQSLTGDPSASFEQPFEMLEACHERVHRMLGLLARLREHMCTHGADEQARQAARDVMRYFDQAAPQHHMDEELHVFPRLLAQGDAKVVATVKQLQQDHIRMEAGWARARQVLAAVEQGALQRTSVQDDADLDAFADLYGEHIRAEEGIAYPAAASLMDEQALATMGQEMMRRRGVR